MGGAPQAPTGLGRFIGTSPAIRRIYGLLEKLASNELPVLITGESGTGKELFARELHERGPRRQSPFLVVNCAAITESLFESELFGYERGAFTGASSQKRGRIELADSGTLFFDEIGEIPPQTQVKLLRFLQEREFERVGGTRPLRVDVRIVAATNRNLARGIETGQFREDLYYRLSVVPVHLPPLRARVGDVELLARHFAAAASQALGRPVTLADRAMTALAAYGWPGNVRELQNVVERAVVLAEGDQVNLGDLPVEVRSQSSARPVSDLHLARRISSLERELIDEALSRSRGDLAVAARLLGIRVPTLRQKLAKRGRPGDPHK